MPKQNYLTTESKIGNLYVAFAKAYSAKLEYNVLYKIGFGFSKVGWIDFMNIF